mmetsp:Transcript_5481/g.16339  ORF Transcript_5481/g.16339 Transcript_5481/m.16339 type:complete len:104 (+) Transcript_5481:175-486(+)
MERTRTPNCRRRGVCATRREKLAFVPAAPGTDVIVGSIAAIIPFFIASYIFGSRIMKQRRCPECKGSGLVSRNEMLVKCPTCGGWLPFQSWKQFFIPDKPMSQ